MTSTSYRLATMLEEMALAGITDPFDKRDRAALERLGYVRRIRPLATAELGEGVPKVIRAHQGFWAKGPFMGGIEWYPYQIALGLSLRYWPCLFAPSIRLHVGPIKVWLAVSFRPPR